METIYRCMTCGNNLPGDVDNVPKCNCSEEAVMAVVTEENKDSLIPRKPRIPDVDE